MKTVTGTDIVKTANKNLSPILVHVASGLEDIEYISKLEDILQSRGLTQKDLSELTGLPISAITDWVGGKSSTLNKVHILSLMNALKLTDVTELFEIRLPEDKVKQFKADSEYWNKHKKFPESVKELYMSNVKKRVDL